MIPVKSVIYHAKQIISWHEQAATLFTILRYWNVQYSSCGPQSRQEWPHNFQNARGWTDDSSKVAGSEHWRKMVV